MSVSCAKTALIVVFNATTYNKRSAFSDSGDNVVNFVR